MDYVTSSCENPAYCGANSPYLDQNFPNSYIHLKLCKKRESYFLQMLTVYYMRKKVQVLIRRRAKRANQNLDILSLHKPNCPDDVTIIYMGYRYISRVEWGII